MCFGNKQFCKHCRKVTINYVSNCEQYPEVKTETPTHAIRGRHRRIRLCKVCKRKHKREERVRVEREGRANAILRQQAKAHLEWRRQERPLPMVDEDIAIEYARLFLAKERLHPYCVGFTNMHAGLIEEQKQRLIRRAEDVLSYCRRFKAQLSDEAERAVMVIVNEKDMFEYCLERQAKIDSGARVLTEADQILSLHSVGCREDFEYAFDLLENEDDCFPTFDEFCSDVPDRAVTEKRLQEEIINYISSLESDGASRDMIEEFRDEVIREHRLDEQTFDYDPAAIVMQGDPPAMMELDASMRLTFRQWAHRHERIAGPVSPLFDRWYFLLNAYRLYLSSLSPQQATFFNVTRNTIAYRTFLALTGRPAYSRESSLMSSDPDHLALSDSQYSNEEDDETLNDDPYITETLVTCIRSLEFLVQISCRYNDQDNVEHFNPVAAFLQHDINRMERHLENNTWPSLPEWESIDRSARAAIESLHLSSEEQLRREAEEESERSLPPEPQSTDEPEPFFIDLTPMQVEIMEPEPDNVAYARRNVLGLAPTQAAEGEWQGEEGDDGDDGDDELFQDDGNLP